jgi:hypothetical protein
MNNLPNADKINFPLVWCSISGGDSGWFHVEVHTTARTLEESKNIAEEFIKGIFPGRHKLIRENANANEERDFERDIRVVHGFCRFAFRMEDGPTEEIQRDFETYTQYDSFGR